MVRRILGSAALLLAASCSPTSSTVDATDAASNADAASSAFLDAGVSNASPEIDRVAILPNDLTTAIGTTELSIWADDGLGATTSTTLADLAAHAQLRTYPELVDVPFTTHMRPPAGGQSAYATRAFVVIQPAAPLSDRWYVLSLSSLPAGAVGFPNAGKPSLGVQSSRFNPGSAPVRRRVSICDKAASERVVVEFSEGIAIDNVGALLMVGDASCKYASAGAGAAGTQSQLFFDCDASLHGASALRFVLKRGIVSSSGAPLGIIDASALSNDTLVDTADRDETLSFAGLTASDGCVDRAE